MNWKLAAAYTALVVFAMASMAAFVIIGNITSPLAKVLAPYKTEPHVLTPAESIAMDGYFAGRKATTRIWYFGEACLIVAVCLGVFLARRRLMEEL